ncbi:MAG: PAS domain S-box protein [Flavobacteriales bacterium]|nr:PAS domain S-box protein [Flavobacteriales bacterium]MCB9178750.1 PAS domain S-box protein [Flavobacteriales bacterium]
MYGEQVPGVPLSDRSDVDPAYDDLRRLYDQLVSRNLAGVFRTTLDGRFLECNDAMARILGFADRAELMALPAVSIYPNKEARERFLATLMREKQLINFELTLKHRNGRPVEVLENIFLDEPENGTATVQGTLIDITAMKQAEIEQASLASSYRSLVEHMRDGVIVIKNDQVHYANPAAQQLTGLALIGATVEELFDAGTAPSVRDLIASAGKQQLSTPLIARLVADNTKEIGLFAAEAWFEGSTAVQVTLQDEQARQHLVKERLRVQMAEEVNQVLRLEIEEHRRTQDALRRSRQFARSLVESSLDMIMAADPEGRITEFNPAAQMRFGYEADEVIGQSTNKLYVDPTEYARIQHELNTFGAFTGEIRNVTKDGEVFITFLAASRLFDEGGQFLGAMGVSRDITRMKRDREALQASEERYRDLFENATDLIQSVDPEGRLEYVNRAWKQALGYHQDDEIVGLTLEDFVHPDHIQTYRQRHARVVAGEQVDRLRTVFIGKDGQEVHVEGTTNLRTVDGRPVATRSIFTDLTHVQAAQAKAEAHEAKLRALFQSSEHMFWTVDPQIRLTSYNRGYGDMIERLHGQRPEINLDPERPRTLFASPAYHGFWEKKYEQAFAGKPTRFETELVDQQGRRVCNEIFLSPVFGVDGKVTEVFGVGHEITEQKEAEDLVRHQAARIKAIFENAANVMIWTLDKDFRITSFNEHFQETTERRLGIHFEEGDDFIGTMRERVANGAAEPAIAQFKAARKGGAQQFEVELQGDEGRSLWVECFLNPIAGTKGVKEISCMAYGITDRKEAELKLRQSLNEKEVLLKEVHHRVKNNLQVISSILSLQTAHVDGDARILELLRVSRDRIRSMSFIHESLYQNKDFSSIDMATYIDGLSRNLVMSYSLTNNIALERDLKRAELVLDQAIPCGLILNELISNAFKHAYPDGRSGTVRIGLNLVGDMVSISVADDGVGLPEGFSAKNDGNLGLELVRTLVGQLDGKLEVKTGAGVAYLLTFERYR